MSKDPGLLFGYRRVDFDKDVEYDELSSDESGVDASKTAKASGGRTSVATTQAKGPAGKTVANVTTSVAPVLLVAASSFEKPTTVPGMVPRTSPPTTAQATASTAKTISTTSSATAVPRVAKTGSTIALAAKVIPTSASSIVPLPLATTSKLRELSESHVSDSSPGKAVSERTRKKTNAKEITDDEGRVVRTKVGEVRDRLTHVHVEAEPKGDIEGMLDDYIAECEKAIEQANNT